MNRWPVLVGVLIVNFSTYCLSQVSQPNTEPTIQCPLTRFTSAIDSVSVQIAIDSTAQKASGKWKLIEIAGGWDIARKPNDVIEMKLSPQGQGVISKGEQVLSKFQLTLKPYYGYVRFYLIEQGKQFLHFSPRAVGYLRLCEEILILNQNVGDGYVYVFKRMTPD